MTVVVHTEPLNLEAAYSWEDIGAEVFLQGPETKGSRMEVVGGFLYELPECDGEP